MRLAVRQIVIGCVLVAVSSTVGVEEPAIAASSANLDGSSVGTAPAVDVAAVNPSQASPDQAAPRSHAEQARLLRLASAALRTRAALSVAAAGVPPTIDLVAAPSTPVPVLRLRVRKDWVEFQQAVLVGTDLDPNDGTATAQVRGLIDRRLASPVLASPIITRAAAEAALLTCSPDLRAQPDTLKPPFFNNDTGVRWLPERGLLALEARAVKDMSRNLCIRGVVNLVTGEVVCGDVACSIQ